jgi:hypothetical protein
LPIEKPDQIRVDCGSQENPNLTPRRLFDIAIPVTTNFLRATARLGRRRAVGLADRVLDAFLKSSI